MKLPAQNQGDRKLSFCHLEERFELCLLPKLAGRRGREPHVSGAGMSRSKCFQVRAQLPLSNYAATPAREHGLCPGAPPIYMKHLPRHSPSTLSSHFNKTFGRRLVGGSLQGNEWQRWDPVDLGPCFLQVAKVIMRGMWTCKWAMERGDRWEESSSWVITNFQWE